MHKKKGAWIAIGVDKYGKIEIGCHIWSYNKKVYNSLGGFLKLDLVDMKPQPYFFKGKFKQLKLDIEKIHLFDFLYYQKHINIQEEERENFRKN